MEDILPEIPQYYNKHHRKLIRESMEKGMEKGVEKGMEKGVVKTALKMIQKGLSDEQIAEYTELSKKRIKELRKESQT